MPDTPSRNETQYPKIIGAPMYSSKELEERVVSVAEAIAKSLGRRGSLKLIDFTCSGPDEFDLIAARFLFRDPSHAVVFFIAPPVVWLSRAADGLAERLGDLVLPAAATKVQLSLHEPAGRISREEPPVQLPPHPLPWRIDIDAAT